MKKSRKAKGRKPKPIYKNQKADVSAWNLETVEKLLEEINSKVTKEFIFKCVNEVLTLSMNYDMYAILDDEKAGHITLCVPFADSDEPEGDNAFFKIKLAELVHDRLDKDNYTYLYDGPHAPKLKNLLDLFKTLTSQIEAEYHRAIEDDAKEEQEYADAES